MVKQILIIDDDIFFCDELSDSLKAEGYSVDYTDNPLKGEQLIINNNYYVILLDYKMPILTGIDIIKKLKTNNISKRIFIITGRPSVEQVLREENLLDAISCIIKKPINFEYLLERINET
jgi:two-component system copper resistance phosphate regulon response regulator CusR